VGSRISKPTRRGPPPGPPNDYSEDAKTNIFDPGDGRSPGESSQKIHAVSMKTPDNPKLHAVSMKTPADGSIKAIAKVERDMPHVRLRAMSEVAKQQHPQNLGNYAPPYDAAAARKRTARDMVLWGCLAVMLASVIALVVWFVAT
jgi:hypothetical protein